MLLRKSIPVIRCENGAVVRYGKVLILKKYLLKYLG